MRTHYGYMTVKEYANIKQVSVQAIYKAIKAGKLRTKKIGHLTLVKPKNSEK